MKFALALVAASLLGAAASSSADAPRDLQAGGSWSQQLFTATDAESNDNLGFRVAASGDGSVVVATAPGHQGEIGKAYVYLRGSDGTFTLSQGLTPSEGEGSDRFGRSACVSGNGNKIAIGAPFDDGPNNQWDGAGAVYIYELQNGAYNETQKLHASNAAPASFGDFGTSVAMTASGDILAVGAPQSAGLRGTVYVFHLENGSYSEVAPLTASDGNTADSLGTSVAVSGTQIISGAPLHWPNLQTNDGAVYVFELVGGSYTQVQKLVASDPTMDERLGTSVAASNGLIFGASKTGIYAFNATSYSQVGILKPANEAIDIGYGAAVGASGNRVVVGEPGDNGFRGAVYVFDKVGDSFVQVEKLSASDGAVPDVLGGSAAVAGNMVVAGAPQRGSNLGTQTGAVYVFQPAPPPTTPWDIKFISVEPDFSTSGTDELVLTFEVGRDRKVEHGVYHKDCSTAIAGTTVTVAETRANKDPEYDTLVLAVDVDKNAIALSNIWNEAASMVEVCTVVHLINEDDELGEMIVAEMKRVTEIDYDLDASYNATLALDEGVVNKDTESFDATSVLSICKCTSLDNFTCSDDPLTPDQNDLFVCYTSVDESIEVQTVLSMTIAQEGRQSFPAISDGAVRVDAISSTKRKEDGSGYAVWTRVPVAFGDDPGRIAFDFAAGSTLTLSGEVSLQLTGTVYNETGSATRKLQAGAETTANGATIEDVASYEIQVELKGGDEQVIEAVSVLNSAASVVIGKVVSLVAVIASLAH